MEKTYPMAIVRAPGKIEFEEHKLPKLSHRDVLIGVKASSICGSDLHIFKGKHPAAPLPSAHCHWSRIVWRSHRSGGKCFESEGGRPGRCGARDHLRGMLFLQKRSVQPMHPDQFSI